MLLKSQLYAFDKFQTISNNKVVVINWKSGTSGTEVFVPKYSGGTS